MFILEEREERTSSDEMMQRKQHTLFDQDFFYSVLVGYLPLIDVSDQILLNKCFFRASKPLLQRWRKYWTEGLPSRKKYNELLQWENSVGITVSDTIRCFYASWQEKSPIFQKHLLVYPNYHATAGRIRQLYDYSGDYLSHISSKDYLCLACTQILSAHKHFDVYLGTFLDLRGKRTGIKDSIFEFEYVTNWDTRDPVDELYWKLEKEVIGEHRSEQYEYYSYGFGMTARNFFELLDMMKENRFYYYNQSSNQLVYWRRITGSKSFLEADYERLTFSDEIPFLKEHEDDEVYRLF